MLTNEQLGVAKGALAGLLTSIAIFVLALKFGSLSFAAECEEARELILAASFAGPVISQLICIARQAQHRFFTPEDINGSGLTEGTARAKLLQALLQNTMEQLSLALPVYTICAFTFPSQFLTAIPAAAAMFLVGRIIFLPSYSKGAASRSFGFALTFYPTILLGGAAIFFFVTQYAT
jgi:hypothetical protein